jgi:hypothetical protein
MDKSHEKRVFSWLFSFCTEGVQLGLGLTNYNLTQNVFLMI